MLQQIVYQIVMILIPLIVAVTFHEFAHIAMAKFLGDDLGSRLNRFSLDPLKHIDPLWTVALPAILIALSVMSGSSGIPFFAAGKPSPYNPLALRRPFFGKRLNIRTGELLIALAGPLSNLLLAFLSMALAYFMIKNGYSSLQPHSGLSIVVQFAYLNVALFVFNLIPIPPLDGAKVLQRFLPYQTAQKYEAVAGQLSWVLFALLIAGGGAFIGRMVHMVITWITWIFMY